jgi:hypothetical protein
VDDQNKLFKQKSPDQEEALPGSVLCRSLSSHSFLLYLSDLKLNLLLPILLLSFSIDVLPYLLFGLSGEMFFALQLSKVRCRSSVK